MSRAVAVDLLLPPGFPLPYVDRACGIAHAQERCGFVHRELHRGGILEILNPDRCSLRQRVFQVHRTANCFPS